MFFNKHSLVIIDFNLDKVVINHSFDYLFILLRHIIRISKQILNI